MWSWCWRWVVVHTLVTEYLVGEQLTDNPGLTEGRAVNEWEAAAECPAATGCEAGCRLAGYQWYDLRRNHLDSKGRLSSQLECR